MHEARGTSEPELGEILAHLSPCDLVLVEGYKREDHLKIEARRKDTATRAPLAETDPRIVAVAADHAIPDASLPVFDLDDIAGIADFIVETLSLNR
jgi:molybdopterin-guanine dinucleotide biosynthesis protein B